MLEPMPGKSCMQRSSGFNPSRCAVLIWRWRHSLKSLPPPTCGLQDIFLLHGMMLLLRHVPFLPGGSHAQRRQLRGDVLSLRDGLPHRIQGQTGRLTAVATDLTAEATRLTVKASRLTVKASRLTVEANRLTVKASRLTVEASRLTVKATRLTVEASRLTVKATRLTVEASRLTVKANRLTAAANRLTEAFRPLPGEPALLWGTPGRLPLPEKDVSGQRKTPPVSRRRLRDLLAQDNQAVGTVEMVLRTRDAIW